jgi:transcriptional regulator with GAF, ATPase, and Fis domain
MKWGYQVQQSSRSCCGFWRRENSVAWGTNLLQVDVRVIMTNKNLRDEVSAGRFREDLLYRLNVITHVVPTLPERADDIPLLSEYFCGRRRNRRT